MCMYMYMNWLSGSVGRASAWYAEHRRFESRLRQLIFSLEKKELSSGVVALLCLVSLNEFT